MRKPKAFPAAGAAIGPPQGVTPDEGLDPYNDDRRKEPRYPAKHDQANLGWYAGDSYQTLQGRLEDVSGSGASLVLDDGTWEGGDVWICLTGGVRTEWVRAEVVGATQIEGSAQRVRLRFHESCPFDFFKTAAWGSPTLSGPRFERAPANRTDSQEPVQGPHVADAAPGTPASDFRELRVAVTMYQSGRVLDREREHDDRIELVPQVYLAVIQLVGVLLIGSLAIVKFASALRLDALLGLGEPRP